MLVPRRASLLAVVFGCVGILALGSLRLDAQEPPGEKVTTAKKASDPRRQVPRFFGQIGLSQDQKEDIYKVRFRYFEKIAALQKQIDELKADEMKELESKITESQKQLLDSRRRASVESKKAKSAAKGEGTQAAKTAEPAKNER
jgi:CRISPR/Cas system-associated protein Cas5 (RAMP superfamily)